MFALSGSQEETGVTLAELLPGLRCEAYARGVSQSPGCAPHREWCLSLGVVTCSKDADESFAIKSMCRFSLETHILYDNL